MKRIIGTTVRSIRTSIIKEHDDLATIVCNSVLQASREGNFSFNDKDIIAITESVVARAQGNYATVDDIAMDIKNKFNNEPIGVIFPILSRNRFATCLKGIAKAANKIILQLSYPKDEVGNSLISLDDLDASGINPTNDVITLAQYRALFKENKHPFTGVDYVQYYQDIIENEGCKCDIVFANDPKAILAYTLNVINCDIHSRNRTKRILLANGGKIVYSLADIMTKSINGSGYNELYGLLGSNKASEDKVKLFPLDCQDMLNDIQKTIYDKTGKHVEVMVYGDGAFKDPQGQIWELADPVVSPFHTAGLSGTPNELKLKYLADNEFANISGEELESAIKKRISDKDHNLVGNMLSEGTTPRQLTDLIGSLCDLTSGSGDKGTPVILIQGYFDNYTS